MCLEHVKSDITNERIKCQILKKDSHFSSQVTPRPETTAGRSRGWSRKTF